MFAALTKVYQGVDGSSGYEHSSHSQTTSDQCLEGYREEDERCTGSFLRRREMGSMLHRVPWSSRHWRLMCHKHRSQRSNGQLDTSQGFVEDILRTTARNSVGAWRASNKAHIGEVNSIFAYRTSPHRLKKPEMTMLGRGVPRHGGTYSQEATGISMPGISAVCTTLVIAFIPTTFDFALAASFTLCRVSRTKKKSSWILETYRNWNTLSQPT